MNRPATVPTAAMLCTVALCIGLGIWQLDRADSKRQIGDAIALNWHAPPTELRTPPVQWLPLQFHRVTVGGVLEHDRTFFYSDRVRNGQRGVDVITPLRIDGSGERLLVNRGWSATPEAGQGEQRVTLTGHIAIPEPPAMRLGPGVADSSEAWNSGWAWLDLETFATRSQTAVAPVVLRLNADTPMALTINWPEPKSDPSMHIGYAIQWFAFALIAVTLWGRAMFRKPPHLGEPA